MPKQWARLRRSFYWQAPWSSLWGLRIRAFRLAKTQPKVPRHPRPAKWTEVFEGNSRSAVCDEGDESQTAKGPGRMSFRESNIPLSRNEHLLRWVDKMAELAKPDAIHWVDGSEEECEALRKRMVQSGTFVK